MSCHVMFQHCVCHYCSDCVCPVCQKWTKVMMMSMIMMMIIMMTQVPSWSYLNNPASHANTSHLMLKWFNSDLVLRNIQVSTSLKFINYCTLIFTKPGESPY